MIYGEKFHRKNPPFLCHSFYFVFIYLCIFQSCLFETAEVKWLRSSTFNGLELTSVNFFTPVANCLIACIWEQAAVLFYVVLLLVVHVVFHLFHVIKEKIYCNTPDIFHNLSPSWFQPPPVIVINTFFLSLLSVQELTIEKCSEP